MIFKLFQTYINAKSLEIHCVWVGLRLASMGLGWAQLPWLYAWLCSAAGQKLIVGEYAYVFSVMRLIFGFLLVKSHLKIILYTYIILKHNNRQQSATETTWKPSNWFLTLPIGKIEPVIHRPTLVLKIDLPAVSQVYHWIIQFLVKVHFWHRTSFLFYEYICKSLSIPLGIGTYPPLPCTLAQLRPL